MLAKAHVGCRVPALPLSCRPPHRREIALHIQAAADVRRRWKERIDDDRGRNLYEYNLNPNEEGGLNLHDTVTI